MNRVAYRKAYRVRQFGVGGFEITVPRVVLQRAAESESQTIEEFIKTHRVVHLFNDFTGFNAAYRFEPDEKEGQEILELSEKEMEELGVIVEDLPPKLTKTDKLGNFRDRINQRRQQR